MVVLFRILLHGIAVNSALILKVYIDIIFNGIAAIVTLIPKCLDKCRSYAPLNEISHNFMCNIRVIKNYNYTF